MSATIPEPGSGWADEDIALARRRDRRTRRAILGLVFVVGVFVIAPVVAMLVVAR